MKVRIKQSENISENDELRIVRAQDTSNSITVNTKIVEDFEDGRISIEALGVFMRLLVMPDDEDVSIDDVMNSFPDDDSEIYAIVQELEKYEYIEIYDRFVTKDSLDKWRKI